MPRGSVYFVIVAIVVVATLVPSFLIACTQIQFRLVLAYVAGLTCGMVVLVAEAHLAKGIRWDEIFEVLLLPVVGMMAGAAWRSGNRPFSIATFALAAGALYVVTVS